MCAVGGTLHIAKPAAEEGRRDVELRGLSLVRSRRWPPDCGVEPLPLRWAHVNREAFLLEEPQLVEVGGTELEAQRGEQHLLSQLLRATLRLRVREVWGLCGAVPFLHGDPSELDEFVTHAVCFSTDGLIINYLSP